MSIGMDYDEYWQGSPNRVIAYRKASYKAIENRNQELWLQGLYFYNAIGVVMANSFASKGSKKIQYLTEPINIIPKTGLELKREQERERQKAIDALSAWAKNWKIQHK